MAHYALVKHGKVKQVIVAEADFIETQYEIYIQTSYNTCGNQHKLGGTPLRGNYAGIGYTYDSENDVFYEPQPFDSWTLNTSTWLWEAPVAEPTDDNRYIWNEADQTWDALT